MLTWSQEDMVVKFTHALLTQGSLSSSEAVEVAYETANLVDEKFRDPEGFTKKYFVSEEEQSA